jgi:cellulose synthase/poly-beta-1,6-N-acetylglucosamine synthase-like glycosyltransferase
MLVGFILVGLSLPWLACALYLGSLALLSRSLGAVASSPPRTKFDVVVPAHDEERGIAATVASLKAVDYPAEMRRIVVVADNCSDATAARAGEAGAVVIERKDEVKRGKGYALAEAFARSLADRSVDAVVVVDADTHVAPNLLRAFDARFQGGATAVQADYCVANRRASWRTRLMHIGFTLFHDVRSRARERMGASAGLRGNGMAFATSLLREVPHEAFTIVEDVEYGIRIGLAGHRVHYAGEAEVFGEMPATGAASRSQRQRWEMGRWLLVRRHAAHLLAEAWRRRSLVLGDLAADLLVPPLSYLVLAVVAGSAAAAGMFVTGLAPWWALLPWGLAVLALAAYVIRGVWLARVGPRVFLDVFCVPFYMVWKIAVSMRRAPARKGEWVRTTREGETR